MKLAIIVPAHNEEKRIGNLLSSYSSFFEMLVKNKFLDYKIYVIINATTDKTEDIVSNFSQKYTNIRYIKLKNGGKGYAVIEGIKHALRDNFDIIGFVDADMATSPQEYYRLARLVNSFDCIIASRYVKGALINPKPTIQRIFASRMYNAVIRALFLLPYRDTQCGAKIFKRNAIESVVEDIGMTQLAFDIEIIYKLKKKGFNVREESTVWSDKQYSTVNFLTSGPWMVLGVVRLRLLNSPFKFIVKVYDGVNNHIWKWKRKKNAM